MSAGGVLSSLAGSDSSFPSQPDLSGRLGEKGASVAAPVSPLSSPLGIYANFASALPQDVASRLEKWELQSVSRSLLPKERIRGCMRYPRPDKEGVEVWHSPSVGSVHYGGLQTCASVWFCPVCAAKIAEGRRADLAAAFDGSRAQGLQVAMFTYTVRHTRSHALRDTLEAVLGAYRSMTGSRPYTRLMKQYGVIGATKALEVTHGANGWHPHPHVALFLPREVDPFALAEAVYPLWQAAAARRGFSMTRRRGLDVRVGGEALTAYLAKWGHEPAKRLWEVEDELTRGHTKRARVGEDGIAGRTPFQLLRWIADTGESQPVALFREYAGVFKGRQQLTWSPGLRDLLGLNVEKSDEEYVEERHEDAVILALLSPIEWRAVRQLNQRGELLELARSGSVDAVRVFVNGLVRQLLTDSGVR